ncbi:LysR family transcriptional regulator [Deinococcus cellulosilyticus]|uniref:Transcriptional regulator n=1 Tax=Deinococcus cellulosilyticus (strain DSM 18568 / NBRC 106333 / KACC 11606 / 5516J-15) TaxID=1223518 RepID=A0A511N8T6_DEIC1|nr:LysR family transcriptional regulator [Deinococcus cellulosilyticus]GEM49255.1 transcriptional regulator [Deinococcus cellulosilyticus NBRC 106333 = KACC 11606]
MSNPDFNLLLTLDAVLAEGSVARAARRLHLSPSAMSRALARLRETTGDPLLVRAGRGLVPTPRAVALREQVRRLVQEVQEVLRPATPPDFSTLQRTFNLRVREGFVENFGLDLLHRIQQEAPAVRLCFVQKTDRDSTALREGVLDLDIGVAGKNTSPEVQTRQLFRDRFIGVVRQDHDLSAGEITPTRFALGQHISIARRGMEKGPIDDTLSSLGLKRDIITVVGDFATALALVRASNLITCVPEQYTGKLRAGLHSFPLPFPAPEITISMLWHPRLDADPVHRWLRNMVQEVCSRPFEDRNSQHT